VGGRIEWIITGERLAAVADDWNRLAAQQETPFGRHAWFEAWWHAFGGDGQLRVCALWRSGELVGAFPLLARRHRLEAMVNEHTPVFSPLARDGAARAQLVEAVLATSLSEVEVDALEGCDPAVEHLIEGAKARGRPSLIEAVHVSPVVEIESDFAAFRRRHREKWREIERRRRKLEREHTADFAPIARPAAVLEELDAALAVEGSGWKGELGTAISSSPQTLLFYRRVAEAFDATGELRLSTLVVDGRLAAFDLALLYRNRYFLLKTGYDESLRTLGPGLSLRLAVVETCFERGLDAHEFLGDDMAYKRMFANAERRHVGFRAYRRKPVPAARYLYRRAVRPLLRSTYVRIRGRTPREDRRLWSQRRLRGLGFGARVD
jgi:CelD/BcsL family acetyltransferase involved in cellulose biosynthesis